LPTLLKKKILKGEALYIRKKRDISKDKKKVILFLFLILSNGKS